MSLPSFYIDGDVLAYLNHYLGANLADAMVKCSNLAYEDLCATIAFSEDYKGNGAEAVGKREALQVAATQRIKDLLNRTTPATYDTEFYDICRRIITDSTGATTQPGSALNFGQAQKWVSTTIKNLYVFVKSRDISAWPKVDRDMAGKIVELLPFLHIPVDDVVLDILRDAKHCSIDPADCRYGMAADIPETPWSSWDEQTYKAFRAKLNAKLFPGFTPRTIPLRWDLEHGSTVE